MNFYSSMLNILFYQIEDLLQLGPGFPRFYLLSLEKLAQGKLSPFFQGFPEAQPINSYRQQLQIQFTNKLIYSINYIQIQMKQIKKNSRFQKIKILGEGTYGKCYLVNNIEENQLCVLKQIQIGEMDQEQIEETMKQARILQALDHPNIIKCLQAYIEENTLNILMDYADGGDLSRKIKEVKGSYLSENQVLNWFTQLCLAIKHVHDRKIIHRDLKSQNIFLTSQNLIKLGDFGIAKPLQMTMQKIKTVVGTPYYMSPEICENKQYSLKTDIWSLGVILFEMCALRPPFDANSLPALALKITRGEYGTVPNHFSKEIKKLIHSLLQVDPAKRPSVNELLKSNLIKCRIQNFLPQGIREREFSHTTLHSQNIFQRDDIKKEIKKLAAQNVSLNSIISPRNQDRGGNFFLAQNPSMKKNPKENVKERNVFDKKKKTEARKRQISEPSSHTPKTQQKKMKSNISLTNLEKKKDKCQYFRKKGGMNQDFQSQLSQIREIHGQVVEMHDQLSSRCSTERVQNKNQREKPEKKNFLLNNFIQQEAQEEDNCVPQNQASQGQEPILNIQKKLKPLSVLEEMIVRQIGQNSFSKLYSEIEENRGCKVNQDQQPKPGEALISLLYGLNTFMAQV